MAGLEIPVYDMPSLVTPTTLIRSQDVWYDDGNVVVQAENIVFKVFRGILASNSTVFADMLSVPQPINMTGPDMYDSCPLIQIYGTPEDARHFLKAIHDAGSARFVRQRGRETNQALRYYDVRTTSKFSVVAGILRLSTKYQVPYLRKRAISHLTTMFPSSLQDFQENRNSSPYAAKLGHYTGLAMEVVNLAKECRLPMLLPISMYYCAVMRLEHILDGVVVANDDGTTRKIDLDWPEKRAIVLGKRALNHRARTNLFGFLLVSTPPPPIIPNNPSASPGCGAGQRCETGKLKWLRQMEPLLSGDKCGPLHMQFDWTRYSADVCTYCVMDGKNKYREGLKKSWEELPSVFELEPWDILKTESLDK